jgi:hypothetical protein
MLTETFKDPTGPPRLGYREWLFRWAEANEVEIDPTLDTTEYGGQAWAAYLRLLEEGKLREPQANDFDGWGIGDNADVLFTQATDAWLKGKGWPTEDIGANRRLASQVEAAQTEALADLDTLRKRTADPQAHERINSVYETILSGGSFTSEHLHGLLIYWSQVGWVVVSVIRYAALRDAYDAVSQ